MTYIVCAHCLSLDRGPTPAELEAARVPWSEDEDQTTVLADHVLVMHADKVSPVFEAGMNFPLLQVMFEGNTLHLAKVAELRPEPL